MKVKELIEHLLRLDPEQNIYFCNGEWGSCEDVYEPRHGMVPYSHTHTDSPGPGLECIGYYWNT